VGYRVAVEAGVKTMWWLILVVAATIVAVVAAQGFDVFGRRVKAKSPELENPWTTEVYPDHPK
jgi:hypothetical protein